MTRNANKGKKFDPTFGPQWMTITEVEDGGLRCIDDEGREQRRHFDDVKFQAAQSDDVYERQLITPDLVRSTSPDIGEVGIPSLPETNLSSNETPVNNEQGAPRRSERARKPNPKYANE